MKIYKIRKKCILILIIFLLILAFLNINTNVNTKIANNLKLKSYVLALENNITETQLNENKTFSNLAEMKQDLTLTVGDLVRTKSYYEETYAGGAYYDIVNSTQLRIDNQKCIKIDNGLYAILHPINDTISVNQFGAYGDGIHDDREAIEAALNSGYNNILFEKDKTYNYQNRIKIKNSNVNIIGNNATMSFTTDDISTPYGQLLIEGKQENHISNISVQYLNFLNPNNGGNSQILARYCEDVYIGNCKFDIPTIPDNKTRADTNVWFDREWNNIFIENCTFINLSKAGAGGSLWFSDYTTNPDYISGNIVVRNNYFEKSSSDEVLALWDGHIKNANIYNNEIYHHDDGVDRQGVMTCSFGNDVGGIVEDIYFHDNIVNAEHVELFATFNGESGSKNIFIENNTIKYKYENNYAKNSSFFNDLSEDDTVFVKNNTIEINDSSIGAFVNQKNNGNIVFENNKIKIDNIENIEDNNFYGITTSNNVEFINNEIQIKVNNLKSNYFIFRNAKNITGNKITYTGSFPYGIFGYDMPIFNNDLYIKNNQINVLDENIWNKNNKKLTAFYNTSINNHIIEISNNVVTAENQTNEQQLIEISNLKDETEQEIISKNNVGVFSSIKLRPDNLKIRIVETATNPIPKENNPQIDNTQEDDNLQENISTENTITDDSEKIEKQKSTNNTKQDNIANSKTQNETKSPKTGDNIMIYISLSIIAFFGIVVIIKK